MIHFINLYTKSKDMGERKTLQLNIDKSRKKKKGKNKNFNLDDLSLLKNENMMIKMLSKHKGKVAVIVGIFILLVVDIILTFLMAFNLI